MSVLSFGVNSVPFVFNTVIASVLLSFQGVYQDSS
jgi:hypothetical protein